MGAQQLEKQLFAIQDISRPLHTNQNALKSFLEKQVSIWVTDAGYDPNLVPEIVNELTPLMGHLNQANIRRHKHVFDEILEQYIGSDVEVSWVVDER